MWLTAIASGSGTPAAATRREHAIVRPRRRVRHAELLEDGREHVDVLYQRATRPPCAPSGKRTRSGHVQQLAVQRAAMGERPVVVELLAVIGDDDEERPVEGTERAEPVEERADRGVELGDLAVVEALEPSTSAAEPAALCITACTASAAACAPSGGRPSNRSRQGSPGVYGPCVSLACR